MEITEHDIRMFYTLLVRYDKTSSNIGVVGPYEKCNRQLKEIAAICKKEHLPMKVNTESGIYRIITPDGIETTYIRIKNINDLKGRTFRKFI